MRRGRAPSTRRCRCAQSPRCCVTAYPAYPPASSIWQAPAANPVPRATAAYLYPHVAVCCPSCPHGGEGVCCDWNGLSGTAYRLPRRPGSRTCDATGVGLVSSPGPAHHTGRRWMASTLISSTCTRAAVAASTVTVRRSAVACVAPAWSRSVPPFRTLRTRPSAMVRGPTIASRADGRYPTHGRPPIAPPCQSDFRDVLRVGFVERCVVAVTAGSAWVGQRGLSDRRVGHCPPSVGQASPLATLLAPGNPSGKRSSVLRWG